ncbi:MAG TPA: hypothetical protein VNL37_03095, partial [Candidatus Polarisedimenticolia bacterium]|nr:hypothetical protein [Candidatus Polarisedimenticolia bacterium]
MCPDPGDGPLSGEAVMETLAAPATTAAPILGGTMSALALALTMFVEAIGYGVVAPTLPFMA